MILTVTFFLKKAASEQGGKVPVLASNQSASQVVGRSGLKAARYRGNKVGQLHLRETVIGGTRLGLCLRV